MTPAEFILSIILAIFASTGFWTLINNIIQKRDKRKDATTLLLLGIAHDLIIQKAAQFIEQGYISEDDYNDFFKYLYNPYRALKGDGTVEKIVEEQVKKLPIKFNC